MKNIYSIYIFFIISSNVLTSFSAPDVYSIGVGIADITGPAADINMVSFLKFKSY